jgi:hypothetical protein
MPRAIHIELLYWRSVPDAPPPRGNGFRGEDPRRPDLIVVRGPSDDGRGVENDDQRNGTTPVHLNPSEDCDSALIKSNICHDTIKDTRDRHFITLSLSGIM